MIDVGTLNVGDKVKIIDHWVDGCHQNPDGMMDHHLGTIMTVRDINENDRIRMVEDVDEWHNGWVWFPESIEYVVCEDDDDTYDDAINSIDDFLKQFAVKR